MPLIISKSKKNDKKFKFQNNKKAVGNVRVNMYIKFEPNRPTRNIHYGRPQVSEAKIF